MNWASLFFNKNSSSFALKQSVHSDELDFFKSMGINYTSNVLEQCCGKGTLITEIGRNFKCKTMGIDLIEEYILEAHQYARSIQATTTFAVEDILNNKCISSVHYVINWNTSWAYFEEDLKNQLFFNHAFKNLKKNGYYILDFYNTDWLVDNFQEKRIDERVIGDEKFTAEKISSIEDKILKTQWIIYNSKDEQIFNNSGITKMYKQKEIEEMLALSGFRNVDVYGSLKLDKPCSKTLPRLLFKAQK